jgi:hypothetical protein
LEHLLALFPRALLIASDTSENIELGKFNIFSITELPIDSPIYGGIGNITSNRFVLAGPPLPLMFARNRLGENDIKIYPLILTILCFSLL